MHTNGVLLNNRDKTSVLLSCEKFSECKCWVTKRSLIMRILSLPKSHLLMVLYKEVCDAWFFHKLHEFVLLLFVVVICAKYYFKLPLIRKYTGVSVTLTGRSFGVNGSIAFGGQRLQSFVLSQSSVLSSTIVFSLPQG